MVSKAHNKLTNTLVSWVTTKTLETKWEQAQPGHQCNKHQEEANRKLYATDGSKGPATNPSNASDNTQWLQPNIVDAVGSTILTSAISSLENVDLTIIKNVRTPWWNCWTSITSHQIIFILPGKTLISRWIKGHNHPWWDPTPSTMCRSIDKDKRHHRAKLKTLSSQLKAVHRPPLKDEKLKFFFKKTDHTYKNYKSWKSCSIKL